MASTQDKPFLDAVRLDTRRYEGPTASMSAIYKAAAGCAGLTRQDRIDFDNLNETGSTARLKVPMTIALNHLSLLWPLQSPVATP